ncbi:hypothetical protein [Microbacterium aurantiacum]|uniref:hypothetical protein n=1 Tax=Microbacterium aurantiacum TaxID=162393 RepID=UPI003440FEE4
MIEVLSAAAEPGTPSGSSSVSFPTAERIGSLDFECYGDGTVNLGIVAQSGDTTFSRNFDAVRCADGATTLDASNLFGDAAIDEIEIIGSYPSAHTAWVAVLLRP